MKKYIDVNSNFIIIFTFLISLFGGVPGIISIVEYFKDKPRFNYALKFSMTSRVVNNAPPGKVQMEPQTAIFLVGTVFNDGKKTLFPNVFG